MINMKTCQSPGAGSIKCASRFKELGRSFPGNTKKDLKNLFPRGKIGGFEGAGNRARTDDLLITNQLLYQLSYAGASLRKDHLSVSPEDLSLFLTPNSPVSRAAGVVV